MCASACMRNFIEIKRSTSRQQRQRSQQRFSIISFHFPSLKLKTSFYFEPFQRPWSAQFAWKSYTFLPQFQPMDIFTGDTKSRGSGSIRTGTSRKTSRETREHEAKRVHRDVNEIERETRLRKSVLRWSSLCLFVRTVRREIRHDVGSEREPLQGLSQVHLSEMRHWSDKKFELVKG